MGSGSDNSNSSTFSKPAIVTALFTVLAALVPLVHEASMSGVSRLLSLTYLGVWIAIVGRVAIQLREGYWRDGLKRPLLFELASLVVIGSCAWMVVLSEDPQIPRLLVSAIIGAISFLLAAGRLEEARAALTEEGIEARRASEVLRGSGLWRMLCQRVAQIRFRPVRRLREFFAGSDTRAGNLSLAAAVVVLVIAALAVVSTGLAVASIVFPLQLVPKDHSAAKVSKKGEGGASDTDPATVKAGGQGCRSSKEGDAAIPEPERSSLLLGWEEVDEVQPGPMEALGYDVAGCPGPAKRIPGLPGSRFRPGYCGAELRSIVIAPEGLEHPVVLLEQAAEFALPLIVHGEFTGAVDRFPVGNGDAYIIESVRGSYVLIRDHSSAGPVHVEGPARSNTCADFKDEDVRYAIAGPGMIEPWRAVAAISLGGVYPIDFARRTDSSETVVFRSPEGIVAEGTCATTLTCDVKIGAEQIRGSAGATISEGEVEALVEP